MLGKIRNCICGEVAGAFANSPSLPLLPGLLWPEVVVHIMVQSMDEIELFNNLQYLKPFNYVQKEIDIKQNY